MELFELQDKTNKIAYHIGQIDMHIALLRELLPALDVDTNPLEAVNQLTRELHAKVGWAALTKEQNILRGEDQ